MIDMKRKVKPVTYTIPVQLDRALLAKVGHGRKSKFVTQALWEALKKDEEALLMKFLKADKDPGNIEAKKDFSGLEGEDFVGIEDFDFKE